MVGPVVVVGAGAAGLVAAWRCALAGRETLLLEANARPGAKIRISGGGRCNVTHDGPPRGLLAAFPAAQARFLRPALHSFSNADLLDLLHREGLETEARADGRVFPKGGPGSAHRVVEVLEGLALAAGARLGCNRRVTGLRAEGGRVLAVRTGAGEVALDHLILATGGASYPGTGTRGEALGWLRDLGLPVRPWFPALAPIPLRVPRPEWEGVALRGGELRLREAPGRALVARAVGDLLFTRTGVSGPAALHLSEAVERARRAGGAHLEFAIAGDAAALAADLQAQAGARPELSLRRWAGALAPDRVVQHLIAAAGLPPEQRLGNLPREGRRRLLQALEALPLGEPGPVVLERGEVCAGGLDLGAVDPRTLRPRGWANLMVCGELLDLHGPVGGYNLQAAFSTGHLAGEGAGVENRDGRVSGL